MPDSLGELSRRWRLAERHLYPTILADPAAYQRYVLAVRGLADELSVVASPEALVASWPTAAPRAAEHLRAVGEPGDEAVAELVAGAAFALREREIAAARAAAELKGAAGRARVLTPQVSEGEDQRR